MSYVPHTDAERDAMLRELGLEGLDDLFACVPAAARAEKLNLPAGMSESELLSAVEHLSRRNRPCTDIVCFAGGGAYDHYIPPAVGELLSRGELYTAYTPYQPEASQGILQATYEYQSAICALTDMDVANASLYDGPTALVEAILMAVRATGRKRIVVDGGISPHARAVVATYARNVGLEALVVPPREFRSDLSAIAGATDDKTAATVLAHPSFYGSVADLSPCLAHARSVKALGVVMAYPLALGLLKSPGAMGADIACGEGQSLGIPLSYGGPYLGYLACKRDLVRRMPGRLVGLTADAKGNRAFALTLQTREQHIRREKATSNVCTNQALCALSAGLYLALVGPRGIASAARLSAAMAEYTRKRLSTVRGIIRVFDYPAFNEFVIEVRRPAFETLRGLVDRGFLGGVDLGRYEQSMRHHLLVALTERRTLTQVDAFAVALTEVLS